MPGSQSAHYYPALDGLRALAFVMVFAEHYLLLPWGWSGVDVFFVLSGFLITGILYDTADAPHRVRNFYVRRTLRIFPLYYGIMLVLLLLTPVFHWAWDWRWLVWPGYIGNFAPYLHPFAPDSPYARLAWAQLTSRNHRHLLLYFGHFWSLCVEEQFYLVWPWIVFWIRDRKKLIGICTAAVIIVPLLRVWAEHALPAYMIQNEVLYRATPFRIDALLLGGLLALVQRGPHARHLLTVGRAAFLLLATMLIVWLAITPAARHDYIGYVYPHWKMTWGLLFVDLMSAALVILCLERNTVVSRIFSLPPLRWLGRISYGAYVFHDIMQDAVGGKIVGRFRNPRIVGALVCFAITIAVSWASFRFFESRFIRLKNRWTRT